MPFYEYKVVPAPEKAQRVKGLKGTARFAHKLQELMNEFAQDGWEYQRAETLPDEERKGLMSGREVVMRTVLVFRRELYFEEPAEDVEDEGRAAPPLTLSQASENPEPPRAEQPLYAEPPAEESMDSIYGGADLPADAEQQPVRRPLVADRKGGPDI